MSKEKRSSKMGDFDKDAVLSRIKQVLADPFFQDIDPETEYRALAEHYRKLHHKLYKTLVISDLYQQLTKDLTLKLDQSTLRLRQLSEVALPICMCCHKIRTNDEYWEQLETFFTRHADILFSHGICPECIKNTYGKLGEQALGRLTKASTSPARTAPSSTSAKPREDVALREMQLFLKQLAAEGNPLTPEIEKIINRYAKLQRRFDKIVSISDSYQSQQKDFNLRLELMARTDLLTGLANRWEMADRLEIEKSRSERHKKTFSLILADIDRFKEINDSYGHPAGDRVLREVAARIKNNCRAEDLCVRWGGDEFLVLLPETDLSRAEVVAEKISRSVRETSIAWEQQSIRITMSFGVGEYVTGNSIEEFIKLVDDSLYSAKNTGRNRVIAE